MPTRILDKKNISRSQRNIYIYILIIRVTFVANRQEIATAEYIQTINKKGKVIPDDPSVGRRRRRPGRCQPMKSRNDHNNQCYQNIPDLRGGQYYLRVLHYAPSRRTIHMSSSTRVGALYIILRG